MDADSLVSVLHKWRVYTVCKHRATAREYRDKSIRVSVLQLSLTLTQMEKHHYFRRKEEWGDDLTVLLAKLLNQSGSHANCKLTSTYFQKETEVAHNKVAYLYSN